ncbi:MAG: 23S rRNA (uracil(1939)-C(5))-methyltransferase RlmD [Calditrichaeota bacterium]|nr:MAG: 23S rRNA (uracil(1939)-C(5))-methyltransferase RlmD [Calditrichota bacterium]
MSRKRTRGFRSASGKPQKFRVKIEDLNDAGAGVAYHERRRILVDKTLPGEEVLVEYSPHRPRKDRIHLIKILETSPDRQAPPCAYFEECGGCHLQHIAYPRQLQFKRQILQRLLLAYPALKSIRVHPVEGMPEPLHYRNKSQMPFQEQRGEAVFGLFRAGTHRIIPIDQCLVETRDANRILQIVREWANRYGVVIYDEENHRGILRHVLVRRGMFTHQVMVVLVVTTREVPHWKELLQELKNGVPLLRSVQFNINDRRTNTILGPESLVVWGEPYIEEQLGRNRFRIYPETFFQINTVQMVRLLEKLIQVVPFDREDVVVDLYCGVGAISLYLADRVQQIIGIEAAERAILAARENADDNAITNVDFVQADVLEGLRELQEKAVQPQVIIVDPPRKGLPEALIEEIAAMAPRAVVYISCNPRSLVRDLHRFEESGYIAREIFPFDMFPQTHHVESLTVLHRR